MTEKQVYNLQINEAFKQLIPPLTPDEYKQLEENILKDGCREPLCVWSNTIVDGHNRYEICTRLKIPFFIQKIGFNTPDEAVAWICANQLGRRNISEETRRYLIGKRYETEKKPGARNISGKNQHSQKEVSAQIEHKPEPQEEKGLTAERIGKEYNLSQATVRRYGKYAQSIDNLAKNEDEFTPKILAGKIKISQENISKLSEQPPEAVKNVKNQLSGNDNFVNYSNTRRIIPEKKGKDKEKRTVKDMPVYDPDAEISSLALTIPSWVGSINRTLSVADINKTSGKARTRLENELERLESTVSVMLSAIRKK